MVKLLNTLRKKVHKKTNTKGFSIVELLFSILILMLSTTVIIQCFNLGVAKLEDVTKSSQAQLLCSALTSSLQNELSYAQNVKLNEAATPKTLDTYFSKGRGLGAGCSISEENGIIVLNYKAKDPDSGALVDKTYSLVSTADYTNQSNARSGVSSSGSDYLKAFIMPIECDGGKFHVTLWVDDANSSLLSASQKDAAKDQALAYSEFYVTPLAGISE